MCFDPLWLVLTGELLRVLRTQPYYAHRVSPKDADFWGSCFGSTPWGVSPYVGALGESVQRHCASLFIDREQAGGEGPHTFPAGGRDNTQ